MATIYYERFDVEEGGRLVGAHVYHKASCPPMRSRGIFMCGVAAPTGLCEIERIDAPFHVLLFILDGSAELFEGEAVWQVGPGQFGVLPRGGQRGFRRVGEAALPHVWFLLRDDPRWDFMDRSTPWIGNSQDGALLWDAVSLFQREACRQNAGESDALVIPALDLVSQLLERTLGVFRPQEGWAARLQALFDAIAREPAADWPVPRLATLLGVTPSHLHRLCRSQLGQPPGQLVFAARMQAAKTRLLQGERVSEVAHAVGYQEIASFSRRFRAHFGINPSEMQPRQN
ncbi:helix-turn-helix transcriptional regulator [Chitinilyticum piscinae]|uniref:Helix-turn-helix transcriptional regulator n=1 Tax=Chitinilyticum piscinae TaxID=2866724 RepID=A0A8J7FQN2_9NEIS|nr:helix-turn-helix transcriptional regulator [Chitinilyticum piscinae]MBE9610514.1 helix-turn-helix transcriptional regulator [Chitinilyticum piscinae]